MIRRIVCVFLTAGLFLSGCNLPRTLGGAAQAWIDAPLDGMRLPLAPYTLVCHASDPLGVRQMEVSINGQVLAMLANPDPSQGLVHMTQEWDPQQAGRYVIRVRAQNTAEAWTDPDSVTVEIEAITPTPSMTITPTATITPTGMPRPFTVQKSGDQFYFGAASCGPNAITLEVQVSDPVQVQDVTLFFHLRDKASGNKTAWNNGLGMQAEGGGKFKVTVQAASIPAYDAFPESLFFYQFAGTNASRAVVQRSDVYSDISLSACGAYIAPGVDCSQYKNPTDCNANSKCTWPMGVGGGACTHK